MPNERQNLNKWISHYIKIKGKGNKKSIEFFFIFFLWFVGYYTIWLGHYYPYTLLLLIFPSKIRISFLLKKKIQVIIEKTI